MLLCFACSQSVNVLQVHAQRVEDPGLEDPELERSHGDAARCYTDKVEQAGTTAHADGDAAQVPVPCMAALLQQCWVMIWNCWGTTYEN